MTLSPFSAGQHKRARTLSGAPAALLAQAVLRGSNFLVLVVAGRLLLIGEFGWFSLAVAVAGLLGELTLWGLDSLLIRSMTRGGAQALGPLLLAKVLLWALLLPATLLYLILARRGMTSPSNSVLLLLLGAAAAALSETAESRLLVEGRNWHRLVAQCLSAGLAACGAVLILVLRPGASLAYLVLVLLLRDGLRLAAGLVLVARRDDFHVAGVVSKALGYVVKAAPFGLISLLGFLYFRVDIVIMGVVLTATDVARYAAAYSLLTAPLAATSALAPLILRELTRDVTQLGRLVRVNAALGTAVCAAVVASAPWLILHVYGVKYGGAGPVVRVLALTIPFSYVNTVLLRGLYTFSLENVVPKVLVMLTLANCWGNVLLQQHFGPLGAAWATVVTEVLLTLTFAQALRRKAHRHALA